MTLRSILTSAAGLLLLAGGASAQGTAPRGPGISAVAVAAPQVRPVAAVERDDEPSCSRARRRLWIEGEGWVVRRITTCR